MLLATSGRGRIGSRRGDPGPQVTDDVAIVVGEGTLLYLSGTAVQYAQHRGVVHAIEPSLLGVAMLVDRA
jgi:hypothetical protein